MSHLLACLVVIVCVLKTASARRLAAEAELAPTQVAEGASLPLSALQQLAEQAPIQLGDGSERIISSASLRRRGGAVKALGRPALAKLRSNSRYQGTIVDLAQLLDTDDDLAVDAVNAALLYVCEGLAVNVSEVTSGVDPSQPDPAVTTVEQAFALSSRPSSRYKIFLDFDGHTTTGTLWNTGYGRDPIITPPFDTDGSPSTWSAGELSSIAAIWRGVSEDYALFDVDVTTADPGPAALSGNGIRVAIGGSWSDWYPRGVGGVAYVNSFTSTGQEPCFTFPSSLANNVNYITQSVSHEVGHTLGLNHDGTTTSTYFHGQGNWAPIMGTAYYKPLTTFDKGEYAGANNQQDDLAVIGQTLPLLPQKFGSDAASAAPMVATIDAATGLATAKAAGVVATAAGDWFSFTAAAGPATLSASVVAPWGSTNRANLDVQLTLTTAAGDLVAVLNPASLDVPATQVTLPAAGTYILALNGVGSGDPAATGYSSYGSRGQYELTVVAAPLPVMCVTSISMNKVWAYAPLRTHFNCTVTVTIRDTAGMTLPGVQLLGQWIQVTTGTSTYTAVGPLTTTSSGTASARSGPQPSVTGSSCTFAMVSAAAPGYRWDPASCPGPTGSLKSRTLSW